MLTFFFPAPLVGVVATLLYGFNLIFWVIIVCITDFKLLPFKPWQRLCDKILHKYPEFWNDGNNFIMWLTTRITWEIKGIEKLSKKEWYLLLPNHQAWTDILVLETVFNRKIPILKFFMKKELLWQLPLASQACQILNFPFMERYSKDQIAKNPHLCGVDIARTRKACEKFKYTPTTIINFVEGTRFTPAKHQRQCSPYKYLLKPKAGGIARVLAAMEDSLQKILNVTIVYSDKNFRIWDLCCGRIKRIHVNIEILPITADLIGDYENDATYRTHFHNWLNEEWLKKDRLIDKILGGL